MLKEYVMNVRILYCYSFLAPDGTPYNYDFAVGKFYRPAFAWGESAEVLPNKTLKMAGHMMTDVSSMMHYRDLKYATDFIWVNNILSVSNYIISFKKNN